MLDNFEYEVTKVEDDLTFHTKFLFESLGGDTYQVQVEQHTVLDGHKPHIVKSSKTLPKGYQEALRAFFAKADREAEKEKERTNG